MSKTRENSLVKNFQGKFGDQFVYKTVDGVTILAKLPKRSLNPPTESQADVRENFSMAADWAKNALLDPDTLAAYSARAEGMRTPYILAVTNYLKPPKVKSIDASDYTGAAGSLIRVKAWDSFEVKSVSVKITDATGALIEEGACQLHPDDRIWVYTATEEVTNRTGVVVTAVVKNRPNHTGSLSLTL